ncbi:MAG: ATP-binding protein [Roseburia sp.]|nr:ATP-binding protein [Roseburia sp.]
MWEKFLKLWKRLGTKFISDIIFYVFTALVLGLTVQIAVKGPMQVHFKSLAENDVWFGGDWYYVDEAGEIGDAPVPAHGESYLRADAQDNQVTITKVLDTAPSAEDYLCFRVKARNVSLYVNDTLYYKEAFRDEYLDYTLNMYGLHLLSIDGLQAGDRLTLTLSTRSADYFIIQFPAIGDRYALTRYILAKSWLNILTCILLLGLIVFLMLAKRTPVFSSYATVKTNIRWLAIFLLSAAIYVAADSGCLELLIPKMSVISWLTDTSILLIPIPLILYTQHAFFPGHRRYGVFAGAEFLVAVGSILAFVVSAYDIVNSYIYVHVITAVAIAGCVISFIQEKMMPGIEVIIGYAALSIAMLICVIVYWGGILYPPSAVLGIGLIIFGGCMLTWVLRSNYELRQMREEAELVLMQRDKLSAQEANEQKSRFLSHMSHEIRTPLNAMLGMNELIMRDSEDEEIRKYAINIQNAGRTLLALINDVLDFSKIETGKMDIIESDYSLSSALNDVVLMIQSRAADKGLELRLDIDPAMPDVLRGDEIRIKQVILNLMTNAVKYTEKGWLELAVNVTLLPEQSEAVSLNITVSDSGVGIREQDLSKIFSEFERLDRLKNRSVEGTGLGLSITSRLVALMGGTISVDSRYGEGSVFKISVPQHVISHEPIGDYKSRFERLSNEETHEGESTETAEFPGKRVFVVDDNEMNLEVIASILELLKIDVTRASDGQSAMNHLDREKYDLILTDDMMPEVSGTDLMEYLKSNAGIASYGTPVVVLTANAVVGAREEYIKKGFDDYMAKPIDIDVLQKILMKYLK